MVYILITISLDNLVESPCFVCWSYCCLMGISQISKGSRKIEYPRSVCNFILINMWHSHQAKIQQTKIPVTKIQFSAQSSILFRDTEIDFCQARPIVNRKALLYLVGTPKAEVRTLFSKFCTAHILLWEYLGVICFRPKNLKFFVERGPATLSHG